MRTLWLFICIASMAFAFDFDYVQAYRMGGIKALESKIEEALISEKYWNESLKNSDVRFGYYESVKYLFIADKVTSELSLYKIDNAKLERIQHTKALMGSQKGDKRTEGDLKTPVGVYDLTARLTKLDHFYGPLAFVTSYPNLYDILQKKSGSGIWIHGLPMNGDREINTRGCIAIDNNLLKGIDDTINHKDSILITGDGNLFETNKEEMAIVLSGLFKWRNAWRKSELKAYLSHYDEAEFLRFDGMKFNAFRDYKARVFAKNESKSIEFKNINISPYPNERGERFFRVGFYEIYNAPSYSFSGEKELYVKVVNGNMKIITEK
ncbi:MAG: L,D-transpeptidase family protein [Wolinella sp.]